MEPLNKESTDRAQATTANKSEIGKQPINHSSIPRLGTKKPIPVDLPLRLSIDNSNQAADCDSCQMAHSEIKFFSCTFPQTSS